MLTGTELRRIFQVGVGEEVPEYEVVNIHHRRHRRSADSQAVHQVGDIVKTEWSTLIGRDLYRTEIFS